MSEKIAFAAWGFIELCCKHHKTELTLTEVGLKPLYCCSESDCPVKVPAFVYEKISDEILKKINDGKLTVGESWTRRYGGKFYTCEVIAFPTGRQPIIGISTV